MFETAALCRTLATARAGLGKLDALAPGALVAPSDRHALLFLLECFLEGRRPTVSAFLRAAGAAQEANALLDRLVAAKVARIAARRIELAADFVQEALAGFDIVAECFRHRERDLRRLPESFVPAYRLWRDRADQGYPPRIELPELVRLSSVVGQENLHVVDMAADDPDKYAFRILGRTAWWASGGRQSGTIGAIPWPVYQQNIRAAYSAAARRGRPVLHSVAGQTPVHAFSYMRLMLPFSHSGRKVDTLAVLIERRDFDTSDGV